LEGSFDRITGLTRVRKQTAEAAESAEVREYEGVFVHNAMFADLSPPA